MEDFKETEQLGPKNGHPDHQQTRDCQFQSVKENPPGLPTFPEHAQSRRLSETHPNGPPVQDFPATPQYVPLPSDNGIRVKTWQEGGSLQVQTAINRDLQYTAQQQEEIQGKTVLPEVGYQNHHAKELRYLYEMNAKHKTNLTAAHASSSAHQTRHEHATQQERVQTQPGPKFPQQTCSQLAPPTTSQAYQYQKPPQSTNYHDFVTCPMGSLPYKACPWRGEYIDRQKHIMWEHGAQVVLSNRIIMTANKAFVLNVYDEHFLCYTLAGYQPDKLYCVVQHACTSLSRKCGRPYQYRCEISATNRYEKITETRLVGDLWDDFETLVKQGRCVRWDAEVVNHFIGNDEINVSFKISVTEPI